MKEVVWEMAGRALGRYSWLGKERMMGIICQDAKHCQEERRNVDTLQSSYRFVCARAFFRLSFQQIVICPISVDSECHVVAATDLALCYVLYCCYS